MIGLPLLNEYMRTFPEVNREARGHDFYAGLENIPAMYSTEETPTDDKLVVAHFFNLNSDWWIVELDPESMETFGYAVVGGRVDCGEWGYSDLPTLESATPQELGALIERDCHWTTKTFAEAMKERGY